MAFSYISPSTGIFTLFALGLTTIGGVFIWTWPVVALGQFIIALNFAEVSSHFPLAGLGVPVDQVHGQPDLLLVHRLDLPVRRHPDRDRGGGHAAAGADSRRSTAWAGQPALEPRPCTPQLVVALITLVVITVLNIYGVRLVAIINNTGVLFEILGMFVFAIVLMSFHNHQGFHVVTNSGGLHVGANTFLVAMFMSLFVIYGFDTASTLAEETRDPRRAAPKAVLFSIIGAFIIGGVFLLGTLMAIPNLHAAITGNGGFGWSPAEHHRGQLLAPLRDDLPAGGLGRHLRLLPVDHGRDDPALLRHVARQPAAVLPPPVAGSRRRCTRRSGPASRSRCSRPSRSSSTRAPAPSPSRRRR